MTASLFRVEKNTLKQDVKWVDASWHMPSEKRDAQAEYAREHIPGAVFFNLDDISDPDSPYPHMLPSPERFAEKISALGISNDDHVVVYDTAGLFSAPRAWWMFRVFGHNSVSVLDGGLPQWKADGLPLEQGIVQPSAVPFISRFRPELVRSAQDILAAQEPVLDARSADRFHGRVAEPRPGLRSGHIPGSRNLPWNQLLDASKTHFLPPGQLQAAFVAAGIDPAKPLITSCGSGVSACILALALDQLGQKDVAVYDGSWAEWGSRQDLPIFA